MSDLSKSLSPIVSHLKSGKKVTVFQGAGVSTGAGIPDFRSPKTGLYSNLAKLNLPFAEAVFDIDYFRETPKAFYTLAHELYPGKFQPTAFHYFLRLLQDKNLLKRIYTQNIDTLERVAGIKDEYIVEAHGSFALNHCIDCHKEMSVDQVKKFMADLEIPTCPSCKAYVKPDITFFGESLPAKFFTTWDEDCDDVEFAIVAGTSLTVYPFASLPSELDKSVTRVLINKEAVGDFVRKRKNDHLILHSCDTVAEELCEALGWTEELQELKKQGFGFGDEEEEVKKIATEIEEALEIGDKKEKEEKKQGKKEEKKEEREEEDDLLAKVGNLKI